MTIAPTAPIAPDEKTQEFYVDALRTLDEEGIQYAVGGGYAMAHYTGIARNTKDLDIFVCESDHRRLPKAFRINFNRCIFCGLCAEACPTLALQMSTDFEMAETDGRELIYEKEDLLVDHGGKYPDYSFWDEAGVAVTHALGQGHQDRPPSDPRSNLP